MDLLQGKLIILVFLKFVSEAFCCDLTSKSERFECGNSIKKENKCSNMNCCYGGTGAVSKCYFLTKDAAGGPIRHPNGLCIYPEGGSNATGTKLTWSFNCHSRNALFLVSNDYPTYHIATGLCILPENGEISDPGDGSELVLGTKDCKSRAMKYRPAANGNLKYFYLQTSYDNCIGGGFSSPKPRPGDHVKISKEACKYRTNCSHLTYVFQKQFSPKVTASIRCPANSLIRVTWARYCTLSQEIPAIFRFKKCQNIPKSTSMRQERCNGNTHCTFTDDEKDLKSEESRIIKMYLVVRYTCDLKNQPAPPDYISVEVLGPTNLRVTWSSQKTERENIHLGYRICWHTSQDDTVCDKTIKQSKELTSLRPLTTYFVTVARYICEGEIGQSIEGKETTPKGQAPVVTTSAKEQTTETVTPPLATTMKSSEQRTTGTTGDPDSNSGGPTSVITTSAKEVTTETVTTPPSTTMKSSEQETRIKSGRSNDDSGGGGKAVALIGAAAGGGVLIIVLTVLIILVIIRYLYQ